MGTFITVGNGTQSFARLFNAIAQIHSLLPQPVTVQTGHNDVDLPGCTVFKFTDQDQFRRLVQDNELIISHGGVGTLLTAVEFGRRPVVVPRLGGYGEIANDHQLSLMKELTALELIHPVAETDPARLGQAIVQVVAQAPSLAVDPARVEPLKSLYLDTIRPALQQHLARSGKARAKICLVSACGGHLTELRKLRPLYEEHDYFHVLNDPIVEPEDMKGRTQVLTLCERDWRGLINFVEAARILWQEKPDLIVSTGAWPAIPFAIVGRLFGIPNLYVETMAVVDRPTMTGKAMYRLAHSFFYPWRQLQAFFPAGTYCGVLM
jgi:beta-1,4-N-acetylglucosaminyltransferase